jgi:hypothetical protein
MTIIKFLTAFLFAFFIPIQASADFTAEVRNDVRFGRVFYVVIGGTITTEV